MPLKVGSKAPDFTLPSTNGSDFNLYKEMAEKPCIVYFYPKDFTSVCTAEACDFRDSHAFFNELGVEVIGISRDSITTHLEFKKAHQLNFELLCDAKAEVAKEYAAVVPLIGMIRRVTYLLDGSQNIMAVYEDMFSSKNHIKEMIKEVKNKEF